jgi:hypothetical protein
VGNSVDATVPARAARHAAAAPGARGGARWWVAAAFGATLALATLVLLARGTGKEGLYDGLRATARLMFVPFWLAYAGGALATLFGPRFQPLRQRGRELGLAFTAALLVHLGLVAWICLAGVAPGAQTFVIFGAAAGCAMLLALFSLDRLQALPGARGWWLLRVLGMNYIALAFAEDFLRVSPFGGIRHVAAYLPFAALAVAGPALRLAAWAGRAGQQNSHRGHSGG